MDERLWAQTKQRFASEILWHFVGRKTKDKLDESYNTLISILRDGLKVSEDDIDFKYRDPDINELVTRWGYPVSCLSDIPFKDLVIQAERYGTLAIGFHKERVIDNSFNPVLYVNTYSFLLGRFMKHVKELEEFLEKEDKDKSGKFQEMLSILGSLGKSGDLKANPIDNRTLDEFQLNNFYYEREWRSIYDWDFNSSDVALIIVEDDQMVEHLRNDIEIEHLRINKTTPILPFRMVYRL
ncbi:MAG: abortive infection system antitoxin AbiGi family protein [Planctomycetota bacterium]|jgi:hypothetical protein